MNEENKTALFAGGCFWCVEHDLREVPGVSDVISGYAGGEGAPTYENHEGYVEAVKVIYDPEKTSFKQLCEFFLDHIDPTDAGGQFHDRGESYVPAIYCKTPEEMELAKLLLAELDQSGVYDKPSAVRVLPEDKFYKAEEYHQKYAEKNPEQYKAYKEGSGRAGLQAKVCQIREQKKITWQN